VSGSFYQPSPELASTLGSLRGGRTFTCSFDESRRYQEARRTKGTAHETWTFAVALETLTPAFNVPLRMATAMSPDLTMLVPEDRVLSPADAGCRNLDAILPRLRRAAVRTLLSADPLTHPSLRLRRVLRPDRIAPLGVHVYELASPLARAHVASHVVPVGSRSEGARQAGEPGFLEAGGAAVEGGTPVRGARGRVERMKETTDRLDLVVETDSPTVLVVRDGWAPGWEAWVNGQPTAVRRADGRHLAAVLPEGRREVVLRYRPPGLWLSLAVSALALGALGVLSRPGRRRASPEAPSPRA
jgi:hypothetical protein